MTIVTRYYVVAQTAEKGFVELTETEWYALMGTEEVRPYTRKVYRGEMDITEVPEELREAVQTVVNTRMQRWGLYAEREIPDTEALNILTGGDPTCPN